MSMKKPFPAYRGDEPYVFISYAHADEGLVVEEISWLHDLGIHIWYDEGIEPGSEWREDLAQAIRNADLFILLTTPNAVASENCRKEVNFALDIQCPVLALHLTPTKLPDGLRLA